MVQVQGDGHAGAAAGVGGEVDKERVGVCDGPGEEEDLGGRALGFGGADGGDYGFEVVLVSRGSVIVTLVQLSCAPIWVLSSRTP